MEKNFVARISAIISNFERNVRKAQRMAKTSIPDEIETEVTANTNKFQRAIQRAKAMAQNWREHKVQIDANTSPFTRTVSIAKAKLATWREHTVKLKLDRSNFDRLQNGMASLWQRSAMALDNYQNKMDNLANRIRTMGTVFGQQVKGVMIASFQVLIPVIAGVVPVIFAVLNAIKAATGGVVAFAGAAAIGFAGFAAYAGMAMTAIKMLNNGTIQASAATRNYQSALNGVKTSWEGIVKQNANAIFRSMANGLNTVKTALQSLLPFFKGVADGVNVASKKMLEWAQNSRTAQKFFQMMNTTGVAVFNKLLSASGRFGDALINVFTQLAPLFMWSANWLDRLGASFQKWANSAKGQNSIKQFMEYTKTNLPIIGNIFKNTFAGIFNLMKAFGANSTAIFKYLEQMSAKFRQWSETVGKSEGFKKFVEYMRANGPVIMQLIGNIVRALVAFGVAMAPIASVLLRVITAIAGFVAKLFETHPAIARIVGVLTILGGIFWALMAPIIAINSFLGVFGTSILSVAGKLLSFVRNAGIVTAIVNVLKGAFTLLTKPVGMVARLLPLLGGALSALTGPVGIVIAIITALVGIIIWLWKTNDGFRNAIVQSWQLIKETVGGAIQGLIAWFVQLWNSITTLMAPLIPLFQQIGAVISNILGVVLVMAIKTLVIQFITFWTIVKMVFTLVGGIIMAAVQLIVGLLTAFIQFLSGDFSGAWLTLQNTIGLVMQTIWTTLQTIWAQISSYIFNVLSLITGRNITSWSDVLNTIISYMTSAWSFLSGIWGRISDWIGSRVEAARSFVSDGFQRIVGHIGDAMAQALGRVISGMANVVSSVGSGVSNAVERARSFISGFVQAGVDMIQGMINGIGQMAGRLAEAAAGVASKALAAAKSKLGIHSPSREFMSVGMYSMKGFAIGIQKHGGGAVATASRVAQNITDAFTPDLSLDSDLTNGLGGLTGNVDAHMTKDVRHSIQENNRPIVNVNVHNESDIPAIKSYIDDQNSRDSLMYT